jgi:virulence factor
MANAVHYPSLAEFEDIEILALCDLLPDRLENTAERFGIAGRYTDAAAMLDEVKPDAAYVLTPPHHLYDLALLVLSKGIHLFIEKPPGVTSFQTRSLRDCARRNECLTMVAFNRRYIPLMTKVREMAEARGRITNAVSSFYKNMVGSPPYYGGAIDMLTCDIIHAVDALRWMCGEATKVASTVRSRHTDYMNSFNALMEFDGGATGVLLSNFAVGARVHTFEMHTKGFSAYVDPNNKAVIYDGTEDGVELGTEEAAGSQEHQKVYGFFHENRHFIDSLRSGKEPMTSFEDAAKTMELVDRIYQSRI